MENSVLFNLILEIVIILLLIRILFIRNRKVVKKNMQNLEDIIETIYSRTSIRKYLDKTISDDKIEILLRAAMSAPSAVNKQPWHFVVVKDKKLLNELAQGLPFAEMAANAPLAIIACGNLNKALKEEEQDFWIQDVSAASENILLAAHALKLGAVWTGVYPIMDRVEYIQGILNLPSNIIPLNLIPIGYPAETHPRKLKWNKNNYNTDKWE